MIEKTPLYFEDFKAHLDKLEEKLETHEPRYFKEFRKELDKKFYAIDKRFDKIDETLESHSDQIGELKVGVTKIEMLLAKKADHAHVKDLEHRTKKLENAVFA